MNRQTALLAALAIACGCPGIQNFGITSGFTVAAQAQRATGVITDENGEPLAGVSIIVKGKAGGVTTDIDGKFSIAATPGATISFSYVGYKPVQVKYEGQAINLTMTPDATNLDEVVVTALGIKKDKKSLGYAIDDMSSEEIMRNKTANPLSSLSGKIAGVNITQSSGAAGAGAQIILRGGTSGSESRDNQPLFVVDGIIYDNSAAVGGNSAFDGSTNASTTSSNRLMDINPEDIENMSILKGPAAAALYGSRAANGVVLITTKKGKSGSVEVNVSTKYINSWVKDVPQAQTTFKRGFLEDQYENKVYTGTVYNDFAYTSWGDKYGSGDHVYSNNIDDFFQHGNITDTNVSVAGGTDTGNFFLSGSYFDQGGVVPETGYRKATFRFNGEQKWKIFTFGANVAYSQSHTKKTLTSGGLYGSSGNGALQRVYGFGTTDDMSHYLNDDGTRYRMFGDRLNPWEESDNPYWIINKNPIKDKTSRFTGNFNVKADLTDWWWVSFRMGIDEYKTDYSKRIARGGVVKQTWQDGMMSDNSTTYEYVNTNLMTNFNKTFGDFNFNLLAGFSTDNTHTTSNMRMASGFIIPDFYSYQNVAPNNRSFQYNHYRKRLVGLYGEFRADWKNTIFLTVSGRNDWTSTLPKENRSYFYPAFSGAVVVSEWLKNTDLVQNNILTFAKLRASWAKVGKDTDPYSTATSLWPFHTYLNGIVGSGNSWTRGNPVLKPEMTKSTELGLELRFFQNRLKVDYAYYTNDSEDQILSPRGPQSTGYIFCSVNAGNVENKGMELSSSGTPIETKDWTWETGINIAGNRGKFTNFLEGSEIMYLTDVQYGTAKAAIIPDGNFMAIAGYKWMRVEDKESEHYGKLILDKNGMPQKTAEMQVGNREPKFSGGWNNTLRYKNFTFNMLWEFRVGGDVFNGTKYYMTQCGTSKFSEQFRQQTLVIDGVKAEGGGYTPVHYEYEPDKVYSYGGTDKLGYNIIKSYYTDGYYANETRNYITKVNSLRLRSISLTYQLPRTLLEKTKCLKGASVSASATNLLLFTNYDGDPEAAASGAGVGGSSSVGFDYCGVPSTASFAFGVNLTF